MFLLSIILRVGYFMARSMKLLLLVIVAVNISALSAGDGKSPQLEKKPYKPEMKNWDPCLLAKLAVRTTERKVEKKKSKIEKKEGFVVKEKTETEVVEEITGNLSGGFNGQAVHLRRTTSQGAVDTYDTFLTWNECSIGCSNPEKTIQQTGHVSPLESPCRKETLESDDCWHASTIRYSDSPKAFQAFKKACGLLEVEQQQLSQAIQSQARAVLCESQA